jgi:hypothetical protein
MARNRRVSVDQRNGRLIRAQGAEAAKAATKARPHWDHSSRTLVFKGCVVKHFEQPVPNAELLVEAFEEQHWRRCIDDPLPVVPGRNQKRRLHATIQNLNRRLDCRLLIFGGDGFGTGVRWQPA